MPCLSNVLQPQTHRPHESLPHGGSVLGCSRILYAFFPYALTRNRTRGRRPMLSQGACHSQPTDNPLEALSDGRSGRNAHRAGRPARPLSIRRRFTGQTPIQGSSCPSIAGGPTGIQSDPERKRVSDGRGGPYPRACLDPLSEPPPGRGSSGRVRTSVRAESQPPRSVLQARKA